MLTRRIFMGAVSALALAASTAFANADVIKLGILAPLTGPAAADGQEVANGVKLAVEDLNKAGGIAGHTFEAVVADVGDASADKVATAAERLLGDQATGAIFTGYASTSNFEIDMMAEQDMIYLVSGNSQQTKDIVSPDPSRFTTVWSLTPSYDAYNTEIVPVIDELATSGKLKLPNKKVALVASDNP